MPGTHHRIIRALVVLSAALLVSPRTCNAQVDYVARFVLEKDTFLLGEPIYCDFILRNTGTRPVTFSYRTPDRAPNRELEQEPRLTVWDEKGEAVDDPAPQPCGGAKGSAVYGFVTLPPGQTHSERWLLNQWARIRSPGAYRARAERRLALFTLQAGSQGIGQQQPAAYALAINELAFGVSPSTTPQLEAIFRPYLKTLDEGADAQVAEALLAVTTLPQPFLLHKLQAMANASAHERRWDRRQALEGLARLGTPAAWESILSIARGGEQGALPGAAPRAAADDSLRAYAVLLLGEKADTAFLPTLLEMISNAPPELRGSVLRALGFFHDPRANQALFERLHSSGSADRVNAILGLKNLESKDAIPALMAMLNDREAQVRQVAHFALESLTGLRFELSPQATRAESARAAERWHAWWRERGATFVPVRQPACHDW